MPSILSKAGGSSITTTKKNYILDKYDDFYLKLIALLIQAKPGLVDRYPKGIVLYL